MCTVRNSGIYRSSDFCGLGLTRRRHVDNYYVRTMWLEQLYGSRQGGWERGLGEPRRTPTSFKCLCWSFVLWGRKQTSMFCPRKPTDPKGREIGSMLGPFNGILHIIKPYTFFSSYFLGHGTYRSSAVFTIMATLGAYFCLTPALPSLPPNSRKHVLFVLVPHRPYCGVVRVIKEQKAWCLFTEYFQMYHIA